jgi:hypothetical protein
MQGGYHFGDEVLVAVTAIATYGHATPLFSAKIDAGGDVESVVEAFISVTCSHILAFTSP